MVKGRNELPNSIGGSTMDIKAGFCNADPITQQGKRIQMAQIMSVPLLPIVVLVVETLVSLMDALTVERDFKDIKQQVRGISQLGLIISSLTLEQGLGVYYLSNRNLSFPDNLTARYEETNQLLHSLDLWPDTSVSNVSFSSPEDFIAALDYHRSQLRNGSISLDEYKSFYSKSNAIFDESLGLVIQNTNHGREWQSLLATIFLMRAKGDHSLVLTMGEEYFRMGHLSDDHYDIFITHDALHQDRLYFSTFYSTLVDDVLKDIHNPEYSIVNETNMLKEEIHQNLVTSPSVQKAQTWINISTKYEMFLSSLEKQCEKEVQDIIKSDLSSARLTVATEVVILLIVFILIPIILVLIHRMTKTIQNYALGLSDKTRELRREKKRSDALLYQMLPKSVALQLKMSKRVTAESFSSVTVYFSDIVGFTTISARSSPMEVVEFLNKLYFFFDSTIDRYDVYKVETIGDAYMVASGLPQRNGKRHSGEIASMSLDLLEGIRTFQIPHLPHEMLKLRIGLHSGPVVTGVVGSKMPRYCLFGDTVNKASSMESNGVAMKIHISAECKVALDSLGGWITEPRGPIDIKGCGVIETWFLLGKKAPEANGSVSPKGRGSRPAVTPATNNPLPLLSGVSTAKNDLRHSSNNANHYATG